MASLVQKKKEDSAFSRPGGMIDAVQNYRNLPEQRTSVDNMVVGIDANETLHTYAFQSNGPTGITCSQTLA